MRKVTTEPCYGCRSASGANARGRRRGFPGAPRRRRVAAAYFDRVIAPDFVMVHGEAWTRGGGQPTLVDDKLHAAGRREVVRRP